MSARADVFGTKQRAREPWRLIAGANTCVVTDTRNACGHASGCFGCSVCEIHFLCTTFIQPSCFACSALAKSLAWMCFAATRKPWSRLRLVAVFSWWFRFVGLSVVCGDPYMCVANGGAAQTWHVSSLFFPRKGTYHLTHMGVACTALRGESVVHMCLAEARNPWSRFRCLSRFLIAALIW